MIYPDNHDFRFHSFSKSREDGSLKWRQLQIPNDEIMAEHRRKLTLMHDWDIPMPNATGGLPGKTILHNVLPHADNETFYMVDLLNAFAGVNIDTLVATATSPLVPSRYEEEIEAFIRTQASSAHFPGLPQGAPCSPFLFNLYCLPMDRELAEYCESKEVTYTRYIDDLTFSTNGTLGKKLRRNLRDIIERHGGMQVNHRKSKLHHLANGPVTITGVSIQPDGRIQPSPRVLDEALWVFDDALTLGRVGLELTHVEIGKVHGHHGAINQMTEGETPAVRKLNKTYAQALASAALK